MWLRWIQEMMEVAAGPNRLFPATILYNENWLLRIVLHWFATNDPGPYSLAFAPGARWFSEAWLPSAFLPRQRRPKDPLAEGWTHADGAIGHFEIGAHRTADLSLSETASQLVIIEAKLYSRLSLGVKNAPYYDQAARTVACMAEVLRPRRLPAEMAELAFYVVAPRSEIQAGAFSAEVNPQSIEGKVRRRVAEYGGARDEWLESAFVPIMRRPIIIDCLPWEDVIDRIRERDRASGEALDQFYRHCLSFNQRRRDDQEA